MARYAELVCPRLAPCCKANGEAHDVGACQAFMKLLAGASNAKFNQAAADACLDALEGWACTADEPDVCDNVFTGTVKSGGACDTSADCAAPVSGGVTCHVDGSAGSQGVCKLEPVPAAGQPCGSEAFTATEHFVCEEDAKLHCSSGVCEKKPAVGQPCQGYPGCAPGAYCNQGTCEALAAVGESCGSVSCVEGAFCDVDATCEKKKAPGEACQSYEECQAGCDAGTGKCRAASSVCFTNG